MLSKKELDFFGKKTSLLYRNGTLGLTSLLKSGAACVSSLFLKKNGELTADDVYFGLYETPEKTVCSLFRSGQLGLGFVKSNGISWLKYLVKGNKLPMAENLFSPSFDVIIEHFNKIIEKNGGLDKQLQKAFIDLCGDRLYMGYFFPNLDIEGELAGLRKILSCIDNEIILGSDIDEYHKHYLLSIKNGGDKLRFSAENNRLEISCGEKLLYSCEKIHCRLHKIREKNGSLKIYGELRSAAFIYAEEAEISLYANINGSEKISLELHESCNSYYRSYEKTARFYFFVLTLPDEAAEISFCAKIKGIELPADCYAEENYFFSCCYAAYGKLTKNSVISIKNGKLCIRQRDPSYNISELLKKEGISDESLKIREAAVKLISERIWLYSDYSSVKTDNGYFQFIHDSSKNDSIKRYYISHSPEEVPEKYRENTVRFGSEKHIELFLAAEKILAAYVDAPNSVIPFGEDKFRAYSDLFHAEIIYLQHGVLHAHIPWRYSSVSEVYHADRIVVSSGAETDIFTKTYNFSADSLIKTGMPRYDLMTKGKKQNKVLFAPSWRAYIDDDEIRELIGKWVAFLDSEELAAVLEKYDLRLDVKLHPMFEKYSVELKFKSDRVNIAENAKAEEYLIFITDFSSYVFDLVYLKTPIFYYFPDYKEFICGKYQYRRLDISFEKAFGKLCKDPLEAVKELEHIAEKGFQSDKVYSDRMENFFLPLENCSEKLYREIMIDK